MSSFWQGFLFILRGYKISSSVPNAKKWIWIPTLISITIFVLLFSVGTQFLYGWLAELGRQYLNFTSEIFLSILLGVIFIITFLSVFILSGYFIYSVASIIASPFYSVLAEKTLEFRGIRLTSAKTFSGYTKLAVRMLWISVRRSVVLLTLFALLFILAWIPGLNLISTLAAFVILAFDIADYSFEARQMSLASRFADLRSNILEYFGMGMALAMAAIIPGLILLVMPYAIVGASDRHAERLKKGSL